ncbi:MAG: hypothetical protein JF597_49530 [Streptomyces sp.]|uniref:hypothetical protein n=1 Tax=Streptomyces sp. TaxID=1931 RepID=UPI0025E8E4FC|nr:hypothetical protein [Streptomyces sp.]MBW8801312.1 hypothetical protein [Streptomyces sp.]
MATVFDHGTEVLNTGHGHLESAIDNVVTGWKGDAAKAASTSVLGGAMTSRQSAESSSNAADNVRSYAARLGETRAQILAVPAVDTSFGHAVQASGGPVAAAFNPGAVAANMAAAQIKSEQHREQAASYLKQMNDDSEQFAAQQQQTFQPVPPPPRGFPDGLPTTVSVHAPSGSGGGGAMPPVNGPSGGPGGSGWNTPGPGPGRPITPVKHPYDNGGRPETGNAGNPTSPTGPGNPPPGGPIIPPEPPPGDPTQIQGSNPPGTVSPTGPPVALPDPSGSGTGVGTRAGGRAPAPAGSPTARASAASLEAVASGARPTRPPAGSARAVGAASAASTPRSRRCGPDGSPPRPPVSWRPGSAG